MTDTTATHCPTCAAPIREESSKFCAFCGTKLPEPAGPIQVVVKPHETSARERIEAALAHPSIPELMAFTPNLPPRPRPSELQPWMLRTAGVVVAIGGLLLSGIGVAGLIAATQRHQDVEPAVSLILTGVIGFLLGVVGALASLRWKPPQSKPVPELARALAVVSGKRTETSGGQYSTYTSHFVALEFAGGERREYPVSGPGAGTVKEGDVGMAYIVERTLLHFRRIDV